MRGLGLSVVWMMQLALTVPAAGQAVPPAPAATADPDSVFARADRLLRRGAPDSVLLVVDPIVERSVAAGDARNELRGRLHQAGGLALTGRLREAEATARRALDLAGTLEAPAAGRMARRWLGYALLGQGRGPEAAAAYTALRQDAEAAGDRREEAYARLGLGYLALGRGEAADALTQYERSAALFAAVAEPAMVLDAQVGLARALGAEGRYADMRRLYEHILEQGEHLGQARVVGYALNNLGSYEYQAGDPGRAVVYWNRALEARRGVSDPLATITPTTNLALARMALGAFDEARATLQGVLERCRAGGFGEQEAQVLEQMATFEQAYGRQAQARALWRQVLATGAAARKVGLEAAAGIIGSLVEDGRAAQAVSFADSLARAQPAGAGPALPAGLELARAGAQAALGDHRRALESARRARAAFRADGFRTDELAALVAIGASERELGRSDPAWTDSALVHLREAQHLWEEVRAVPRDPLWRERRGALATTIHMDLAGLLLEYPADLPEAVRAARAFDALQGYKARTLLERRLGPDAFTAPVTADEAPVTLERLQRDVLKRGEVLLDYYLGDHQTYLFMVTDTGCRAVTLPSARALRGLSALFLELVATPPVSGGAAAPDYHPAAGRLARELLSPCAPELGAAGNVLIAADGLLNRVPFELLPSPGPGGPTLGAAHAVMRIPSATMLARLRAAGRVGAAAERGRDGGLCVLREGGESAPDELRGAAREAGDLGRRFRRVRDLEPAEEPQDGQWLQVAAGAAVLHVPAHSEVFDQRPWNSRIRVGADADGRPWWLVSSHIAAARPDVPLVVLSSCSSAGGQALSGEGMLGLTGAFLAAGADAVVASLWSVDDAATALLMERFYDGLAAGRSVSAALAGARAALAAEPATAAPAYWAGFVVVGDGARTVPVQRRSSAAGKPIAAALAIGALGLAGALLAGRRRTDSRPPVISERDGTLP